MKIHFNIFSRVRDIYANRHEPENLRTFVDIYWRTVLMVGFLVTVFVVTYGIWNLMRILKDLGTPPDTSPRPIPTLDRATLKATIQAFDTRQTQFDAFKAQLPTIVPDPSK